MIQLIAIDIDGTLITPDGKIGDRTKRAIHKAIEYGIHVAIASGRPMDGVVPYLKELGLDIEGQHSVVQNGVFIQDNKTHEAVSTIPLSKADLDYILKELKGFEGFQISPIDKDEFYVLDKKPNAATLHDAELCQMDLVYVDPKEFSEDHIFAKVLLHGSTESIDEFEKKMPEGIPRFFNTVRSAPFIYEILPKEANKGAGVALLAKFLGVPRENVMAIGDELNDVQMMEWAGVPVAMGNANPKIKALAKYITAKNTEDGVGKAIEELCLT